MTETTPADFDGCNSRCRRAGKHTLTWGLCEHAARPEPTVSMSKIYTDPSDGHPSIGYDTYTVPELARLIEPSLGDPLKAAAAARAIVHRNEAAPAAATVPASAPTDSLRDHIAALFRSAPGQERLGNATPGEIADAVLAVLPEPTDRAAILREAADAYDAIIDKSAGKEADPRYWSGVHDVAVGLRAMADAAAGPGGVAGEAQQPVSVDVLRCVCGDPVQLMDDSDPTSWIHSPGSDTRCLDARPRCPHCRMPHDLTPDVAAVCASIRASIADRETQQPETQAGPVSPAYARLQAAVKKATEAAHLHAMHGMRRTFHLARRYGTTPIPAAEVLNALGLDENANTVEPADPAPVPEPDGEPSAVCVCGHNRGEHLAVSGRLLCDACDPDSTDNRTCDGFDEL
jgi:hypothetical protein